MTPKLVARIAHEVPQGASLTTWGRRWQAALRAGRRFQVEVTADLNKACVRPNMAGRLHQVGVAADPRADRRAAQAMGDRAAAGRRLHDPHVRTPQYGTRPSLIWHATLLCRCPAEIPHVTRPSLACDAP
eukprot:4000309-Prymnesium_polylepis.3